MVDPAALCKTVSPYPNGNDPCLISETGVENSVQFQTCSNMPSSVDPTGYRDCLWMYNATPANLTTFDFNVPLPVGFAAGDTLTCVTIDPTNHSDPTLTPTAGCNQTFGADDTSFNMSFIASPFVKPDAGFFLFMDFDGLAAPDSAGVVVGANVSVPEPGELGLFGLGLLGIGMGYGWKKRRSSRQTNYAA